MCDIAVLGADLIEPAEMNFLFTKALAISSGDFDKLYTISTGYSLLLILEKLMSDLRKKTEGLDMDSIGKLKEMMKLATEQALAVGKSISALNSVHLGTSKCDAHFGEQCEGETCLIEDKFPIVGNVDDLDNQSVSSNEHTSYE